MYNQNRKTMRLKTHNYSAGAYFITVCTYHKQPIFGTINNGIVELSDIGKIAEQCLILLPTIHRRIALPCHIVMPDHIHFVLMIDYSTDAESTNRTKMVVPKIIQSLKSAVSKHAAACKCDCPAPIWQQSYYDRIIRNENEFHILYEYIRLNPQNTKSEPYL